jgi:WD40 repeat protein/serine/threonine protein kinase
MSQEKSDSEEAREREVFLTALEQKPEERDAFLDMACARDAALRRNVDALLRAHEGAGDFLETPVAAEDHFARFGNSLRAGRVSGEPDTAELLGESIERYKLLRQLGEGGCGVVYLAEQEAPVRRRVALKVIRLGMDTKSVIARFEAESQALALMDHPNIAKVLDAGATATGRPFFVMELVCGTRITEYCEQANLPTETRLALFIEVCQAIQHAHQKGIIHRDIKPSNILISMQDGVPVPKVIDFGVAKAIEHRLTGKTLFTELQALVGTPAYMSPEQAELSGLDIDTRSDVYSLGVLLYELLAGQTPFEPERLSRLGLDEVRRVIREEEPPPPSARLSTPRVKIGAGSAKPPEKTRVRAEAVRGDLDWIVMKCLEKDRARRYSTVSGLVADLQRYLANEPVLARPPSELYRFQKWAQRHRGAVAATAIVATTLVAATVVSLWLTVRATQAEKDAVSSQRRETILRKRAEHERERATENERLARLNEYVADMNVAYQSLLGGNYSRALQTMKKHEPRPGQPDLRGFEWRYLRELSKGDEHIALPTQGGNVLSVAFSPAGDLVAAGTRDKVQVWSFRSNLPVASLRTGGESIAFLANSNLLVTGSRNGVRLWRTSDWTEPETLPDGFGPVAASSDGSRLATACRGGVCVWDTTNWKMVRVLPGGMSPMVFSPDAKQLATDSRDGVVVWALDGIRSEVVLIDSGGLFMSPSRSNGQGLVFTPDGKRVIAGRNAFSNRGAFILSVWDVASGHELGTIPENPEHVEHAGVISSVGLSADGHFLVSASWDHSIRVWDLPTKRHLATLHGHLAEVWSLAVSPDGRNLITGAKDGGVNLWPMNPPQDQDVLAGGWEPLAISPDGATLAAIKESKRSLVLLNLATRETEQEFELQPNDPQPPPGRAVAISADFRVLVQGLPRGKVKIWDTNTRKAVDLRVAERTVDFVALSPDGASLIAGSRGRPLQWWSLAEGSNLLKTIAAERAVFSSDGHTLAAFERGNGVQMWDVTSHSLRTNFVITTPTGWVAALSPDGSILASTEPIGDASNTIALWDTRSGRLIGTCVGHLQGVWSVAFSPDGKTLASTGSDCTLKLWNVATQQELMSMIQLGSRPLGVRFSPDGQILAWSFGFREAGGVRLFRAPFATGEVSVPPVAMNKTDFYQ